MPESRTFPGAFILSACAVCANAQVLDDPAVPGCLTESDTRQLPSSGAIFIYTKQFDCKSGLIGSRTTDKQGNDIDLDSLLQAEKKARLTDVEAKISKELRDAAKRHPNRRHRVLLWLEFDEKRLGDFAYGLLAKQQSAVGETPAFTEAQILDIEGQIVSFNRAEIAAVSLPFQQLAAKRTFFAATHSPVVGIRANAKEILEYAEMPQVHDLFLDSEGEELNGEALVAHRVLDEWEAAEFGAGRRVAVLESEPLENNLFLRVAGYFRPGDSLIDSGHAHLVGGSIGSLYFSRLGSSPLVTLFSANTGNLKDSSVAPAVDWVVENRVDISNLSWGGLEYDGESKFRDRLFDYHSRYNLHSFVAAAGNGVPGAAGIAYVASPALAWNVIAVGNIETGPNPDPDPMNWSNDTMGDLTSFVNPLSLVEKPNVSARGTNVQTIGPRSVGYIPRIPFSGTSAAAPFVTAELALAMNRNPTLLPSPEASMATIMATAWNNVEGPADRPISSQDGAGGIHTSAASRLAANYRVVYRYISRESIADRGFLSIPVQLRANDRTRIAIAWSAASVSLEHSLEWLQTDLDIVIFEGRDDLVCCNAISFSKFNNFELVDFVPRQDGWHTIAVFAPRLPTGASERVGIAVSRYAEDVGEGL